MVCVQGPSPANRLILRGNTTADEPDRRGNDTSSACAVQCLSLLAEDPDHSLNVDHLILEHIDELEPDIWKALVGFLRTHTKVQSLTIDTVWLSRPTLVRMFTEGDYVPVIVVIGDLLVLLGNRRLKLLALRHSDPYVMKPGSPTLEVNAQRDSTQSPVSILFLILFAAVHRQQVSRQLLALGEEPIEQIEIDVGTTFPCFMTRYFSGRDPVLNQVFDGYRTAMWLYLLRRTRHLQPGISTGTSLPPPHGRGIRVLQPRVAADTRDDRCIVVDGAPSQPPLRFGG